MAGVRIKEAHIAFSGLEGTAREALAMATLVGPSPDSVSYLVGHGDNSVMMLQ